MYGCGLVLLHLAGDHANDLPTNTSKVIERVHGVNDALEVLGADMGVDLGGLAGGVA